MALWVWTQLYSHQAQHSFIFSTLFIRVKVEVESISISLSLWTMFTWTLLRHTSPFHSPMWVSLITSLWSYYPSTCHSSTMWNHQWGAWRWARGGGLLTTTPVSRNWLEYVCPTGHRVLAHRSEHLHINRDVISTALNSPPRTWVCCLYTLALHLTPSSPPNWSPSSMTWALSTPYAVRFWTS